MYDVLSVVFMQVVYGTNLIIRFLLAENKTLIEEKISLKSSLYKVLIKTNGKIFLKSLFHLASHSLLRTRCLHVFQNNETNYISHSRNNTAYSSTFMLHCD